MGRYEVEAYGKRYEVEADSAQAAQAAFEGMANPAPQPATTPPAGKPSGMSQSDFDQRFNPNADQGTWLDTAVHGLSAGFSDELLGAAAGLYGMTKGADFGKVFAGVRDMNRGRVEDFRDRNPTGAFVSEAAGAVLPALAPMGALTKLAQAKGIVPAMIGSAGEGAVFGGLYGAGSAEGGLKERALGAVKGGLAGAAFGAASQPLARLAAGLGSRVGGLARGVVQPEAEAARRLAMARTADDAMPQPRLSAADEAFAASAGQPVFNIDRGGEATRALARSAANTSPEGRIALQSRLMDRSEGQGVRVTDVVRRMVGGESVDANREILRASAARANAPAYRRAMTDPAAASVWDETLEVLTGDPTVQTAMRQASATGRHMDATSGIPPIRNPFVNDPQTGILRMRAGISPNLAFWDQVKKNLDRVGTREARQSARVLREHLDTIVPTYRDARSGAAKFFGAEDALEAGEAFVTSRMANEGAARAIRGMSKPERQLFAEGFADGLVRKVLEAGDNRNVIINGMFSSPAARQRIEIALGKERAAELEAALRIEGLLNMAKDAVTGNSTTARQLAEIGLAGGSGAYGLSTGDWRAGGVVLAGILARRGLGAIDANVAKRVAQKLASDDPALVQEGIRSIARSESMMNALRRAMSGAAIGQAVQAVN